ncbi:MAG: cobalamin biosynthesis protein [Lysobacterales bacterium]|jgi:AmpE protein
MTIISILIAFTLCHFLRELRRLRRFEWVGPYTAFCNDSLKKLPGWTGPTGFIVLLALPLVAAWLVNSLLYSALGHIGEFLFAIVMLIYTFGPRDLDVDVRSVIHSDDEEHRKQALEALLDGPVPEDPEDCRAAAINAVFSKALKRWFAIIFWFAVLGIYGALLYRLATWLLDNDFGLHEEQQELLLRLCKIMEWPVAQLMTLALAIATDFDAVFAAWKKYHDERGHGLFEGNNEFMLTSARTIVFGGFATNDGYADQLEGQMVSIKLSMDLVWRSLGVWATALAILLLVDVIA